MKVVYINNYPDISVGGDSRVAWELARSFADYTDNEVWMIKPGDDFKIERDVKSKKLMTYSFPGEEIDLKFHFFKASSSNIRKIYKILTELKPDVLHGHIFDPICYICQSWALNNGVPFVYTSHVLPSSSLNFTPSDDYIYKVTKIIKYPYISYTKSFYKGCSSIVTLNEHAKEDFDLFMDNEPLRYDKVPNGAYLDSLDHPERQAPNNNETIKMIFVGHVSRRKNQSYLIKALKFIKSNRKIELLLPGSHHNKAYFEEVSALVEELKEIKPNIEVTLPGHVDHDEIIKKYKEAHYFLSASTMEVQSLVIIEALASGLPMVSLANETTLELIQNGKNGYVTDIDTKPQEFAKLIDQLLTLNERQYLKFSQNANSSAKTLSWKNVVIQTEILYSDLISNYKKFKMVSGLERIREMLKFEDDNGDDTVILKKKKNRFVIITLLAGLTLSFLALFNLGSSIKRSSTKIKKAVGKTRKSL